MLEHSVVFQYTFLNASIDILGNVKPALTTSTNYIFIVWDDILSYVKVINIYVNVDST